MAAAHLSPWRLPLLGVAFAAIAAFAACDRTDTRGSAALKTTSPAGTSTAPSSADAAHRNEALVRVIQAAPTDGSFDLFAGDLALFDGLTFKSVTAYRAVDGKRYAFQLRPSGMAQAEPLSTNTEGLDNGHFYTVVAMPGDDRHPHLRVVSDRLDAPAAGQARLRVVNAGVDAGSIAVRTAGASGTLLNDVEFRSVSDYRDVPATSGTLEIVDHAGHTLASVTSGFEPGRYYTIVLSGSARGEPRLDAFLIEDAFSR